MKANNDIDTYIKLKYGYPLTIESYDKMPDELICAIYSSSFLPIASTSAEKREQIKKYFNRSSIVPYWGESPTLWNIIREYHERN